MKTKLLLFIISLAALSSCTTLYKSGQTPDDVYFSPNRTYGPGEERKEEQKDEVKNNSEERYYDNEYRTIRLGINNRRWRSFDNDYRYNPYNYGFNHGYYYNPYFWPYPVFNPIYITPSNPKITTPRTGNLGGYSQGYNNTSVNPKTGGVRPVRSYNNNNGSAVGNVIRQIFVPGNTNNSNRSGNSPNTNSSSNNTRSYTPSSNSSSSSSSGSSSSGSGGVSRPPRSGRN